MPLSCKWQGCVLVRNSRELAASQGPEPGHAFFNEQGVEVTLRDDHRRGRGEGGSTCKGGAVWAVSAAVGRTHVPQPSEAFRKQHGLIIHLAPKQAAAGGGGGAGRTVRLATLAASVCARLRGWRPGGRGGRLEGTAAARGHGGCRGRTRRQLAGRPAARTRRIRAAAAPPLQRTDTRCVPHGRHACVAKDICDRHLHKVLTARRTAGSLLCRRHTTRSRGCPGGSLQRIFHFAITAELAYHRSGWCECAAGELPGVTRRARAPGWGCRRARSRGRPGACPRRRG